MDPIINGVNYRFNEHGNSQRHGFTHSLTDLLVLTVLPCLSQVIRGCFPCPSVPDTEQKRVTVEPS